MMRSNVVKVDTCCFVSIHDKGTGIPRSRRTGQTPTRKVIVIFRWNLDLDLLVKIIIPATWRRIKDDRAARDTHLTFVDGIRSMIMIRCVMDQQRWQIKDMHLY